MRRSQQRMTHLRQKPSRWALCTNSSRSGHLARLLRRSFLLFPALLFASPFATSAAHLLRYQASHQAMGTVFTVAAYGTDEAYLAEVTAQVFQEIDSLDHQMSNYNPESELSEINRQAPLHAVLTEPGMFTLIQSSLRYSRETDGAFDITVGPLMNAWGFFRGRGRLPDPEELRTVMRKVGYRHVLLDAAARTIRFDEPGVQIDLGGIAKGYAVDRAVRILRNSGIRAALVSSGTSTLFALGSPPGGRGWRVSVRDPLRPDKAADALQLENISLSVSGNYEKFFRIRGKTYAHIIDPRTGSPVEGMLSTVVVSSSATESDALSTAFFVAGVKGSTEYVATHANLTAILYLPAGTGVSFRKVMVRSRTQALPPNAFAEIVSR
jgi:FAD:protein FMN transferase